MAGGSARRQVATGAVMAAFAVFGLSGCMSVGADAPSGAAELRPSGSPSGPAVKAGVGTGGHQGGQHAEHGGTLSVDGASPALQPLPGAPVPGATPPAAAPVQVPAPSVSEPVASPTGPGSAAPSPTAGAGNGGGTGSPSPTAAPTAPAHSPAPTASPGGPGTEAPSDSPTGH
ncbi:hypothetical protein ACIQBJ_09135 [Kitasatospora sp. NPDC088391]|uniref:hypothetical protein n=1 Tax=Kitasatospora sp. NPDC088391 TaxID=3364074 RepID=UPI0038114A56